VLTHSSCYSDQQSSIKVQLEQLRKEARTLNTVTASQLDALSGDILGAVKAIQNREDESDSDSETVAEEDPQVLGSQPGTDDLSGVHKLLMELVSSARATNIQHQILRQLDFQSRHSREYMIHDAQMGTYEWMLEDWDLGDDGASDSDEDAGSDSESSDFERFYSAEVASSAHISGSRPPEPFLFMSWLRSGRHIFHVSGKAGSGKSTLMKYLYNDARTKAALEEWAGGKKLVMAHFYFWRSAQDELQRSLEGLYRSILFEVLRQCPDMISDAFPDEWEAMANEDVMQPVPGQRVSPRAIKCAFQRLVSKKSNPTHRLCLFIDGLDEYSGDSAAHWELARLLQSWTQGPDIKMCISARPHTEYLFTLGGAPNTVIHLHELTRGDIHSFSIQMLDNDPNSAGLSAADRHELARRIVLKAEGVFLWAYLTVRLLIDSFGRRDKPEVLLKRLEGVPEGLDHLYERLLGTVLKADRRRSDLMLLLAVTNPFDKPLNAMLFVWLDEVDSDPTGFPFTSRITPFSKKDVEDARDYVQRQVHSLTKGLLEILYEESRPARGRTFLSHRVHFFHRTARDYLADPVRLETLRTRHFAHLNLKDTFARLRLAEFVCGTDAEDYRKGRVDGAGFLAEIFRGLKEDLSLTVAAGFQAAVECQPSTPLPEWYMYPSPKRVPLIAARHPQSLMSFMAVTAPASWPHFVTMHAQRRYVLHLISREPRLLLVQGDLSLLLSAAEGGDMGWVRELLAHRRDSLYDPVTVHDGRDNTVKVPVWLVALAKHLWHLVDRLKKNDIAGSSAREAGDSLKEWIGIGAGEHLVLRLEEREWPRMRSLEDRVRPVHDASDVENIILDTQEDLIPRGPVYSCTIGRFLALCKSRMLGVYDGYLEPQLKGDSELDIGRSWLLADRRELVARFLLGDVYLFVSLAWEGREVRLPLAYRIY
jgi:hypothetical protein